MRKQLGGQEGSNCPRSVMKAVPLAFLTLALVASCQAATITLSGLTTQSTTDGTGPASNNASLNNILDNQTYSLTFTFAGAIGASGTYSATSGLFSVAAAPASEAGFGSITLVVTPSAGTAQFSVLACLTSGSGCLASNQLTANFSIPAAQINGTGVAATGLDQPHPLDLLEDDGVTDIQATITSYTYQGPASAAPEPGNWMLCLLGLAAVALRAGWNGVFPEGWQTQRVNQTRRNG